MDYLQIKVSCKNEQREIILAFLSQLPFDTFEEQDKGLLAYISLKEYTSDMEQQIKQWEAQLGFSWEKTEIPGQNWNKVWEADFHPIRIGDFCNIRADFHPPSNDTTFDIVVNPKMAFGTGHHETTYMVIETMEKLSFTNKKVLDYGCGTGVLAILAAQCGANHLDAIDYDILSYENTLENLNTNEIQNVNTYHGTLERLNNNSYDIILANINRNVILESFQTLYTMLSPGGYLVISGFLSEDEQLMKNESNAAGFRVEWVQNRNNWLCMTLSCNS